MRCRDIVESRRRRRWADLQSIVNAERDEVAASRIHVNLCDITVSLINDRLPSRQGLREEPTEVVRTLPRPDVHQTCGDGLPSKVEYQVARIRSVTRFKREAGNQRT